MEENKDKKVPIGKADEKVGFKVSLMPTENGGPSPTYRLKILYLIVTLSIGAVLLISAGLWITVLFKKAEVAVAEKELASVQAKTSELAPAYEAARKQQEKIDTLAGIYETHVFSSRVFGFLEKDTLPQVSWANLSFTSSGSISLSGTAADYEYFVKQIEAFKDDPTVKSLAFSGLSSEFDEQGKQRSANFNLTLDLDPSYFVGPKEQEE